MREEDAGGEERCDEGPDALDGLGQVETDLAVPGWTADGKESDVVSRDLSPSQKRDISPTVYLRVCRGFQRRKTSADDLHCHQTYPCRYLLLEI